MNDQAMTQFSIEEQGSFKVERRFNYFELNSDILGLKVQFTGNRLNIEVPDRYTGDMCGLCGECGVPGMKLKNGTLVTIPKRGQKLDKNLIIPVANEWLEQYEDADLEE